MSLIEVKDRKFVGEKFNRLQVIRPTTMIHRRNRLFECLCDCGNICYHSKHDIQNGYAKSCKCLRQEMAQKMGQARKGVVYPKTLRKRISRRKDSRWGKTLNGRAFDALMEVKSTVSNLFGNDIFCYVSRLSCNSEEYDAAQRHLSNASKTKRNWMGKHRVILLTALSPTVLEFIIVSIYKKQPGGLKYVSLKQIKNKWPFGKAERTSSVGLDSVNQEIDSIANALDLPLDFRPERKIKSIRSTLLH
jgi:hypothetical protein